MTTQDKIIEMARQVGYTPFEALKWEQALTNFAKLVEQNKINEIAAKCEKLPFGDTAHSFANWIREQ
jgi:hypothetical protein